MCSGVILFYGIFWVIVGENQMFMGEEDLLKGCGVDVFVVQDYQCIQFMEDFIWDVFELWNEDIGE